MTGFNGYWLHLGFFRAYVNGRFIGAFATPEEAQAALNAACRT